MGGKKTERVDLGVLKTGKELIVCVDRVPGSVFKVLSARKRHIQVRERKRRGWTGRRRKE